MDRTYVCNRAGRYLRQLVLIWDAYRTSHSLPISRSVTTCSCYTPCGKSVRWIWSGGLTITWCTKVGKTACEIWALLTSAYGEHVTKKWNIPDSRRWSKEGREDVQDDRRGGQSKTDWWSDGQPRTDGNENWLQILGLIDRRLPT